MIVRRSLEEGMREKIAADENGPRNIFSCWRRRRRLFRRALISRFTFFGSGNGAPHLLTWFPKSISRPFRCPSASRELLTEKSAKEMESFNWESYSPAVDYDASISTKAGENYLISYSNFGDLDLAEALFRPAEPCKVDDMDELLPSPSLDTARWLAAILNASSVNPPVVALEEEPPTINASSEELFSRSSSSPDTAFRPTLKRKKREAGFRIDFESQRRVDFRVYNGYEPDVEAIAQVKEMIYRAAAMRPINSASLKAAEKPKRKNVKISSDPQTVAARQRRERISERLRILQSLVPGGSKMDTASMLDEAASYLKFLKSQVNALKTLGDPSSSLPLSSSFDHSFAQMQMGAPSLP